MIFCGTPDNLRRAGTPAGMLCGLLCRVPGMAALTVLKLHVIIKKYGGTDVLIECLLNNSL